MINRKKLALSFLLIFSFLLIGTLYVAPQFFIGRLLESQGRSHLVMPYKLHSDEMTSYFPRGREVYDGRFPVRDLFSESKLLSPFPVFPPLITSIPFFIAGGDANTAYSVAQFMFPAAIFLAFYFLGKVVLQSRIWSFFLAFTATLTPLARDLPRGFFSLADFINKIFKNFIPIVQTPFDHLSLYRIDDPLATFLIYIPALIALFILWRNPKKSTALLLGGIVGLLVYTYLHYWIYLATVLFLLALYAFWNRQKNPSRFRYLLMSGAVLTIFLIPYVFNFLSFTSLEIGVDWRERVSAEEWGRQIYSSAIPNLIFYAMSALLVYWIFWKQKRQEEAVLWWGLLGAMPVLLNMQVIAGFNIAADHWFFAFAPPILLLIFAITSELVKKLDKRLVIAAILILISLLVAKKVVNALVFRSPTPEILEAHTIDNFIPDSWDWISRNLSGEPRIGSPSFLTSIYLAVYTSARPYLPTYFNTHLTNREAEDRVLRIHKLFGTPPDFLNILFRAKGKSNMVCEELQSLYKKSILQCSPHTFYNLTNYFNPFYFYYFREGGYSTIDSDFQPHSEVPEERVLDLLSRYETVAPRWRDLPIDYVYYGPFEREFAGIELKNNPELKLVYENGGVEIYQIIR